MRRFICCCCAAVLVGCAKSEQRAAGDTTTSALASGTASTLISLPDVAGKWVMRTMAASGDSVLVTYEMVAGTDASGWTFNFPKRAPIAIRIVTVAGDSIVTEAGPYESVLRKGVQVTTHSVMRLLDGKLVGATVARYATSGPDSVLHLRTEGTRAP